MNAETRTYLAQDYGSKSEQYYTSARRDYVDALPADPGAAVLELGCGNGATGALALAEGKCGSYVGIEMFGPAAREAESVLTRVHVGDVASMELPYPPASFDVLICSEVLEHLVDPDAVLARLAQLLKPGALVMASSPNIAHWKIVLNLLRGRFDYEEFGAMDRTHLRWFTPRSFAAMFESAGIEVTRLQRLGELSGRSRLLFGLLGRRLGHLSWYQIDLRGRRRG